MTEPLNPAEVMAGHVSRRSAIGPLCASCHGPERWPCLPYRLAAELAGEARCRRANSRDSRRMIEFIGVDQPEVAEARAKIEADPYADDADFGSIVIAYVTRLRAESAAFRSGWCPCADDRPQDCKPEDWPNSERHGMPARIRDLAAENAALRAAVQRVRATIERYAITDDEDPRDWEGRPLPVVEYTEPEDVWRLFRDLRAALDGAE